MGKVIVVPSTLGYIICRNPTIGLGILNVRIAENYIGAAGMARCHGLPK
jgi:hypothetical protein